MSEAVQAPATIQTADQFVAEILGLAAQGKMSDAARLYSRCQEDLGFLLIEKAVTNKDLLKRVAKIFNHARDFHKAALCCEQLEEHAVAAVLYEQCGDFMMAAEMYSKVGDFAKAAVMFEKQNDYGRAAKLYELVKDFANAAQAYDRCQKSFEAGKLWYQLKRYPQAMAALQRVPTQDYDYLTAQRMIAEILARQGATELAGRKLICLLEGKAIDDKTIELFYLLAIIHRHLGNFKEARDVFADILSYNFNYQDAAKRFEEVKAAIAKDGERTTQTLAPARASEPARTTATIAGRTVSGQVTRDEAVGVMEGFEHLHDLPIFGELSLADVRSVYNLCEQPEFPAGAVLIEQNVQGQALYVLTSGKVDVRRINAAGQPVSLVQLGPGQYVGEMSLIDDALTSAQVVALAPTTALAISRKAFQNIMNTSDSVARKVLGVFVSTLCQRLRETTVKAAAK